ncbi:MarC family NAAT transporter [Budvicia diplopodorum]|uniref:MarC family NAAT transporter n=1 Tax=Budvicia diplopodorum TaxID=1119056 RepID=UPI0014791422|nr:MarC family NAAT transporter [Budvicia diplopodorum]
MATILEIGNLIFLGLVLLIPLTNPLTSVALFLSLSGDMSEEERHHQAKMASFYVFLILVLSFVGGEVVMSTFGISIPGLRIAGGLIVAYIGFRMLFPAPIAPAAERDSADERPKVVKPSTRNIAFVPLAMPSTAGPGTIAMVISAASSWHQSGTPGPWVIYTVLILTSLIVSLILWISLRSSDVIMKAVGKHGIEAISRVMGFLLVCMGVQFVINGVLEIIRTYPTLLPH